MALYLFIVLFLYILFVYFSINGILFGKKYDSLKFSESVPVTIIIPFRNELKGISELLASLEKQEYPIDKIILADDHSSDGSSQVARQFSEKTPELFKYFSVNGTGKKVALQEALLFVETEWVVCTDADVVTSRAWLNALMKASADANVEMICGPVVMKGKSLFEKIQSLDFLAIVASSFGVGRAGLPFICNASNLAFKKATWDETMIGKKHQKIAGGDDVFFLHELVASGRSDRVHFEWSQESTVFTPSESTLQRFIHQRLRWGRKAIHYTNLMSIGTSFLVFAMSLTTLICLFLLAFHPALRLFALIILSSRIVFDFLLLFLAGRGLGEIRILRYFPVAFLFHQIYIPVLTVLSVFMKPVWKGRPA
jgi:poly-beta-1,6-N-acetyl-D-glucosamine synthase